MHLKTLVSFAESYFVGSSSNEQMIKSKLADAGHWLGHVRNAAKTEGSRLSRIRRDVNDRLERVAILLPKDFVKLQTVAIGRMISFKNFCQEGVQTQEAESVKLYMVRKKIVEKFCISVQICFLLCGGEQRPQLFAQLILPSAEEMRDFAVSYQNKEFISLKTVYEKRSRDLDFPCVSFPSKVFPYLEFYNEIIRTILLKQTSTEENPQVENPLFMDTRTGKYLSRNQIRRTLKLFITEVGPKLRTITPMSLRASYATWMLHRYLCGKIMTEKNENEFLGFLAKGMNNSVERLRNTYAGSEKDDYRAVTKS